MTKLKFYKAGFCATVVAAFQSGCTERKSPIVMDGGTLFVEWNVETGNIL